MKEIFKELGPQIRKMGFRGSGQNFRREDDDFIYVINLQVSRTGDRFFINLGAQPKFIPAECDSPMSTLKEYECVMRTRVGDDWQWDMRDAQKAILVAEIEKAQSEFFGNAKTLPTAIHNYPVDKLVRKFNSGTTSARATLHLARAAVFLKRFDKAEALVEMGLALAGERATSLIADLKNVRQGIGASAM